MFATWLIMVGGYHLWLEMCGKMCGKVTSSSRLSSVLPVQTDFLAFLFLINLIFVGVALHHLVAISFEKWISRIKEGEKEY